MLRKASDDRTSVCPKCENATFSKMLSAPNFQLNGTGWYATDFKDKPKAKANNNKVESKQKTDKAATAD